MPRYWIWIQLLIGWLPIWALFAIMMMSSHDSPPLEAATIALRMMASAALLGGLVYRLTGRLPWPHPFRLRFLAMHALLAALYAGAWLVLNSLVESVLHGRPVMVVGPGVGAYLVVGAWLYVMVTAVAYAHRAAERAALLAAQQARAQLAALRTQLHPHFLFNALHTVVQLIPLDPRGAARATEQLAGALRYVIEEERDLVPLAEEWAFVQRYLEIEGIRFGERLVVRAELAPDALAALVPTFALQTLVENAVRHAAAPRVEPTTLRISATLAAGRLQLQVSDDGQGAADSTVEPRAGTGLRRLRERLAFLFGAQAELVVASSPSGFSVQLHVPLQVLQSARPPLAAEDA